MEPRIEPARAEHLPGISSLAAVIWRAHYPGIITHAQIDHMLARMYDVETMRRELEGGIAWFRALVDGELRGFASVGPTENPAEFKLHKLYVHPECQRCGVGSELLRYAESTAGARGRTTLMLNVNKRNAVAIAVYHQRGFTVREAVTVDIGDGFVMDDFVMVKSL